MPALADVIDNLFPSGDDDVRDVREVAIEALGNIDGDDREELLKVIIQAISQPEIPDEVTDVQIMSLHKCKGLSAAVTSSICWLPFEGCFPKQPEPGTPPAEADAMIEEQRTYFVGITRVKASTAKNQPGTLIITFSATRNALPASRAASRHCGEQDPVWEGPLIASRFIKELGPSAPAPVAG